ncbi:MAG: hypothetical protein ACO2ZL_06075 [Flavobacteriales bacterium]|jgi:hypothetical protein
MKPKHYPKYTAVCAFLLFSAFAFAQRPGVPAWEDNPEKVQALRIAYYVEQLDLTPEESTQFWPVWNAIEDELKSHMKSIRDAEDRITAELDEDQIQRELETLKQLQIHGIEMRMEAIEEASKIIGFSRAAQLHRIERDFRSRIMRARMQQGQRPMDRRPKR